MSYDSTGDTYAHIYRVRDFLYEVRLNLIKRADLHDRSKLRSPEKEIFDEFTPKLKGSTYGSEEYKGFLAAMKPALDHHYAHNSHHPEHYGYQECNLCFARFPKDHAGHCDKCGNGQFTLRPNVDGMSLLDLIEMFCDWKAATERHADGDLGKSIQLNAKRFNLTPQLVAIFENTKKEMGW